MTKEDYLRRKVEIRVSFPDFHTMVSAITRIILVFNGPFLPVEVRKDIRMRKKKNRAPYLPCLNFVQCKICDHNNITKNRTKLLFTYVICRSEQRLPESTMAWRLKEKVIPLRIPLTPLKYICVP